MIIKSLNKILSSYGYKIVKDDFKEKYAEFLDIYTICKPYTMTSPERMFALYKAVEYVVKNNIPGDFVECGVWKGGSSMMIALTLLKFGVNNRSIWMYDTYEGMSAPTENDADKSGTSAEELLSKSSKQDQASVWCYSGLDEVKANLKSTNYPLDLIHFVKGKVEDTIPQKVSENEIALLRLDTDWYESTKHEMEYLYPKLIHKGVLIIDDYGHWVGAKKAIDEYITQHNIAILLHEIDYTGRIAIKTI
ncbi:MAG: class I SAM-dependent methyltransferase [Chitinophagaceae bacterium]|nr:MAG: macrocin-O-methyltransferase [Bacteroidetes bacterium OLB11]MCC6447230.1 class I SAM-dependent methyltransferase [Chitinophagaceae bacterium]HMN32685.1 TylF/MycF/NovP-related O-methyltransferase [Chitinophagaceae bacterium]